MSLIGSVSAAQDAQDCRHDALPHVIADELDRLTAVLSDMAVALGQDGEVLRRHLGALQSIDYVSQVHEALSAMLRSTGSIDERLDAVRLEALGLSLRTGLAERREPRQTMS